jgi:hypothetical protein
MSLPPVTTVQQPNIPITTTTVNPTSSNQVPPPSLHTRSTGWHAKSFGFDWNKRSDQHKYLVKSGLPEVHAAIVNDDWTLALELICPEDFGLLWLPPASQLQPKNGGTDLDASSWTVDLLSQKEDIRNNAILQMALHTAFVTSVGNNCLYGANLLNLCLLKPARPDVLQHVITLAAKQAPQYLNLPDALGRTPLWVAIDNQDQASIQLLLKAGSDPLQACKFSDQGEPKSPLSLVAKSADKKLFRDLLRGTVEQRKKFTSYNFNDDPLFLKLWVSVHSSEDVLWMADQVEALRGPLLCCEDSSGSSYFYRSVINGSLDNKLANGNQDLIEWLKKLDTSPTVSKDIESSPLYAVASHATIQNFWTLLEFFFDDENTSFSAIEKNVLIEEISKKFLVSRTAKEVEQYAVDILNNKEKSKTDVKAFIKSQFELLLFDETLDLNCENYARLATSVWPFISNEEKEKIFYNAALRSENHMNLVFGMLDFSLDFGMIENLLHSASINKKIAAFEFAAERYYDSSMLSKWVQAGDKCIDIFELAISAGSIKWVEKLIDAGLKLQDPFSKDHNLISLLADLDPEGLAKKLSDIQIQITPYLVNQAETEAGKQALIALMANPDKTN